MPVKSILRFGDPRLLQVAAAVPGFGAAPADGQALTDNQLEDLVGDLFATMAANQGAGLAAPQIAVPLRVVVFAVESNPRYPGADAVPETVLINPRIEVLDPTLETAWEGCLSVPGMRGQVARPRAVRYTGFAPDGTAIDREVSGFHARVVQHECDHLDGILYPMRLHDPSAFGFESELAATGRLGPMPSIAE